MCELHIMYDSAKAGPAHHGCAARPIAPFTKVWSPFADGKPCKRSIAGAVRLSKHMCCKLLLTLPTCQLWMRPALIVYFTPHLQLATDL